jgi:hypothetical protein
MWLGDNERDTMLRIRDVSTMRPRVSIVRQITGFDYGRELLARRLHRTLEPATVAQCLLRESFDAPEEEVG